MNKGIKEVLVKRTFKDQVWFEPTPYKEFISERLHETQERSEGKSFIPSEEVLYPRQAFRRHERHEGTRD